MSSPFHQPEQTQPPIPPVAPTSEERTLAMLCHLLGILTSFIGPLIIWLIKKDESPFVDDQGKEALNFQITLFIGYLISAASAAFCVGFILGPVLWIYAIVAGILATVQSQQGNYYRYPFAIRVIT